MIRAAIAPSLGIPPWYFVGLICLPVLWEAFAPRPLMTAVVPSLALATLGLLMAVELHRFTSLRLVRGSLSFSPCSLPSR